MSDVDDDFMCEDEEDYGLVNIQKNVIFSIKFCRFFIINYFFITIIIY